MMRTSWLVRSLGVGLFLLISLNSAAADGANSPRPQDEQPTEDRATRGAQSPDAQDEAAPKQAPATSQPAAGAKALDADQDEPVLLIGSGLTRVAGAPRKPGVDWTAPVWLPPTDGVPLMWIAIVFILALTIRTDAWLSLRNIDGLVLAAACVLLMLRVPNGVDDLSYLDQRLLAWSYPLLLGVGGYWLLRGFLLARGGSARAHGCNVSTGAMLVMLLFSLGVSITAVLKAPVSPAARDAVVGGQFLADTGKLPFGQTPGFDGQSPLLYALQAGATKLMPAFVQVSGNRVSPAWEYRQAWLKGNWWETADLTSVTAVNLLLLALTVSALFVAGRRLHSTPMGLTIATLFCIFPGTVECLSKPDVMLAAALLSWTAAFATLRGVGGLLSTLCLIFAGVAWPWAWLGVPVLAGYFMRKGLHSIGSVVGVTGGAAAVLAGLTWLTIPTFPRAEAALAEAGVSPRYSASMHEGTLLYEPYDAPDAQSELTDWTTRIKYALWMPLINDGIRVGEIDVPTAGVDVSRAGFHEIAAGGEARRTLQRTYETVIANEPLLTRVRAALRSVIETTKWPLARHEPRYMGAWQMLAGGGAFGATAEDEARAVYYRRISKMLAGVVSVLIAAMLFFGPVKQRYNLFGGLLAVMAFGLIATEAGPTGNLALLLPFVLIVLAVHGERRPQIKVAANPRSARSRASRELEAMPPLKLGRVPRISVEK